MNLNDLLKRNNGNYESVSFLQICDLQMTQKNYYTPLETTHNCIQTTCAQLNIKFICLVLNIKRWNMNLLKVTIVTTSDDFTINISQSNACCTCINVTRSNTTCTYYTVNCGSLLTFRDTAKHGCEWWNVKFGTIVYDDNSE